MGDLSAVPQEKIVDYLLERLENGQIYTWVGTLLLAINPNGEIITDNIYDLSRVREYDNICNIIHKEVPPHIFAIAARAHNRIVQNLGRSNQVIVLNGETGTGKTFNAWKALEFLTRSVSLDGHERQDVCGIVRRISDVCRLISAFTTASTERNKASSRHVQLVWLEYKLGGICGASISSYLLERDRVTKGCCNFQIFYQMMAAIANVEFADTKLSKDQQYVILTPCDLDSSRVQEPHKDFCETLRTMDMLGFTEDQKKDIFLILSLLIHMGNIQFVQEDDHCEIDVNNQQSREALKNTCWLARVEEQDIAELLTSILINPRSTRRRHSSCRRNLSTSDACRYRLHSIIRHLYHLLFHWLINSVNEILSTRSYSERLGILDIFGFERFNLNGMEQLCINYVNERLQQYFVEKYLVSCRNDLQKEGLINAEEPTEIVQSYVDRINAIEKYLFTTLNDMCLSTIPNNSSTLISHVCARSCPTTRRFLNVINENFIVRHYSGTVEYSASNLFSKNTDKIPDEISITFNLSKNKFLYSLINKSKPCNDGKVKKPTMLSKLRCNVDLLIEELNRCDTHYVRCIKPQRLHNHEWDRENLRQQLANTGILDVLPLAKCKYPVQFIYKDFIKRYNKKRAEVYNLHNACKNILEPFRLIMDDGQSSVHYGKNLIFLKESTFLQLESVRKQYRAECVKKIESFWIKHRKNQPQQNNAQAIVPVNVQHDKSRFEKSLLERERIILIQDISRYISGNCIEILMPIARKNAYILHWLDGVNKLEDTKNIKPLLLERLRKDCNHNHLVDVNYSKEIQLRDTSHKFSYVNKFRTRNTYEKHSRYYNEKEDMYVIEHGTSTLFYKKGILSRRRPAKIPIRIHIRDRCLTNSHYLVHSELPQGLQDCL
ncbi:hypothetical protein PUN28_005397 [Cardiocondyla obscurior]